MNTQELPNANDILGETGWLKSQKEEFFENTLLNTNRPGITNIIEFCKTRDFYTAPSSANHHSNYSGGLLDHTLLVFSLSMKERDNLVYMKPELDTRIPSESIIISSLLHDICKCCFYVPTEKWKKDEHNNWISYMGYDINDTFPIGHGEKSVIMLQNLGLELYPDEMIAIRYHMGHWMDLSGEAKISYSRAQDICPLMTIIQTADITSSLILETIVKH